MEGEQRKRPVLRNLRIAISAMCLFLCLLFVLMWLRSRFAEDRFSGHVSSWEGFRFYSSRNCLVLYATQTPDAIRKYPWSLAVGVPYWLDANDNRIASVPRLTYGAQILSITLPYWVLTLSVASLGIMTATISRRFSLRTLLIAMTLIAVMLGLIVGLR
jgi:hypothetical protein